MNPSDLIKRFESCELTAYPDPATNGPPYTIGWGCTGHLADGTVIIPGLKISQATADAELESRLSRLLASINQMLKVCINENQMAALASFGWNEGVHAVFYLTEYINKGNMQAAADEFLHFERAAGKPHYLKNRREAERKIFLGET